jgi:hypothetical protein
MRRFQHLGPGLLGVRHHGVDVFAPIEDVRQRERPEPAAIRCDARILGERIPPVEAQRRRAVAEPEAGKPVVILLKLAS